MFNRIILATDFSPNADAALALAIELAKQGSRTLDIVHAYSTDALVLPPPLEVVSFPPAGPTLDHIEAALESRAQQARQRELGVSTRMLIGPPTEVIASYAREMGADLIVIGARGLGIFERALMGSVAGKIVRHAPCPVLIVPRAG